jgi:hypothetical protein
MKWSDEFQRRFPQSKVYFLLDEPVPELMGPDVRIVPQHPNTTYVPWQLWTRFFDDLEFYLTCETYDWYYRGSDDMYFILENFEPYLDRLDSSYEPRRDKVMKAQVCFDSTGRMYPHGGSGWILSRAAAAIIYAARHQLVETGSTFRNDDVVMSAAFSLLNLTWEQVHEPRMTGLDYVSESIDMVRTGDFSDAPECCQMAIRHPVEEPKRFRDVFVWHGAMHGAFALVHGSETFCNVPNSIFFYTDLREDLQVLCVACDGGT